MTEQQQAPTGTRQADTVKLATELLGWTVESLRGGKRVLAFSDYREYCLASHYPDETVRMWDPYSSIADAWLLVEALRERGVIVRIGVFEHNCSVELGRWRDRRAEGIPGDPHTHRSRETFVIETGPTAQECIVKAALRTI